MVLHWLLTEEDLQGGNNSEHRKQQQQQQQDSERREAGGAWWGSAGSWGSAVARAVPRPVWQAVSVLQWCFFNVVMILLNNQIYQNHGFAFPMTLTTIHFAMSYIGAYIAIEVLQLKPRAEVAADDQVLWILPLAAVTCFNVVLGNLSLRYIPLPTVQSLRALAPAICVGIQTVLFQKAFDTRVYLSLVPVVGGGVLAYAPQMEPLPLAMFAALLACVMSVATAVYAELLLQGKKYDLDSINALYYMLPYAAVILAPPALVLEGRALLTWHQGQEDAGPALWAIFVSGLVAFCLNFSLFYTIQSTSAVTFAVAGNLKVTLTLVVTYVLFSSPVHEISAAGCLLTLAGVVMYGWALFKVRQQQVEALKGAGALSSAPLSVGEDDIFGESVDNYLGAMI
eukprot:jgi/Mesen1/1907/ME000143S00960